MKHYGVDALSTGPEAVDRGLTAAGQIAADAVRSQIVRQVGFAPLAPSTLRARAAAGFKGTKALIVTGELMRSITHVIRKKGEG